MSEPKGGSGRSERPNDLDNLWLPPKPMGLARAIAKAGYATRARADTIVKSGRVKVDGRVNVDPASTVGPQSVILLDDQPLAQIVKHYFAFHKPARVISTTSSSGGRRVMSDFFPSEIPGLAAAGRLDANTSGLVLVSNDSVWNGYAAGGATLPKEYKIQVSGQISGVEVGIILAGMHLPRLGHIRPKTVDILETQENQTVLRLVIEEGKNRQVRRMFNALRHDVLMMRRTRIGPVVLGNLPAGRMRPLTRAEVEIIRSAGEKSD